MSFYRLQVVGVLAATVAVNDKLFIRLSQVDGHWQRLANQTGGHAV